MSNNKKIIETLPKEQIPIYENKIDGILTSLEPTGFKEGVKPNDLINFYLLQVIDELRDKTKNGRIRNTETDKLRSNYYKLLINAIEIFFKYNSNNKTEDLETIINYYELIQQMKQDEKNPTLIHNFTKNKNKANS